MSVQATGSSHLWLCAQDSPACFHCAVESLAPLGAPRTPTLTCQPQGAQSRLPRGRSLQAAAVEPRTRRAALASLASGEAGPWPGQMLTEKAGSEHPPCPGAQYAVNSMIKNKHCLLEKTQSFPAAEACLRLQWSGPGVGHAQGCQLENHLCGNLSFWGEAFGLLREQKLPGNRSEWEASVPTMSSEDAGLMGPPGDLRQDEGPLQRPAGVGSSSETLSLGKPGLGGVALSTGESGRESPESDRSALTLSGSENSGGETGGMWAVVVPRAEETSAELETLLGLACRHPKSNPFS